MPIWVSAGPSETEVANWGSIAEFRGRTLFMFGSENLMDHPQIFHLLIKANYPSVCSVLIHKESFAPSDGSVDTLIFCKAHEKGTYKFSKSFSDLQPYYPGVISPLWSPSQKRPRTAREKQFQKMLPRQILQMMSGKTTICQVCCWANICYLEKIKWRKSRISSCWQSW